METHSQLSRKFETTLTLFHNSLYTCLENVVTFACVKTIVLFLIYILFAMDMFSHKGFFFSSSLILFYGVVREIPLRKFNYNIFVQDKILFFDFTYKN